MFKFNMTRVAKLVAVPVLATALLAACGGGGGGGGTAGTAPGTMEQTITSVVDYISALMASNGENSDPVDVNPLTLAADDTAEPQALP